jgi:lipid-A-disaccharide synthase-like uncharacterized protein
VFALAAASASWIGQEHRLFGLDWSYLDILGFVGQALFSFRFIAQWIASERKRESVIPVSFWYWSILGSVTLTAYWILKRNPVGIAANLPGAMIYARNLHLIRRRRAGAAQTAEPPSPPDNG